MAVPQAPAEIDFLGLKALLTPYLDGATWNAGELCDAIIGQFWCGTVVKADGALDPVGLLTGELRGQRRAPHPDTTPDAQSCCDVRCWLWRHAFGWSPLAVLSTWYFHEVKKLDCLSDVSKFLASAAPNDAARAAVREAFDAHPSTALLLNDRFLNVPPNVSTALVWRAPGRLVSGVWAPGCLSAPRACYAPQFALLLKDMQQGREDRDLDASEKKALTFTQ